MNRDVLVIFLAGFLLLGCSVRIPNLGVESEQLKPCPNTPNCVSSQAADKPHFIQPIGFNGSVQDAQQRLLQILKTMQQTKIVTVHEDYIRVEFSSKIFGFIDDAEFYIVPVEKNKVVINFRSASRVGYSDLGVNRKRIEQIRSKFAVDQQQ